MASVEVRQPVVRVEDAEDVHAGAGRFLHEGVDDVIRVVRVSDGAGRPQQHLEEDVRNAFPQLGQALPRVFLEEPHTRVEGRAAPVFEAEQPGVLLGVPPGDGEHVERPHPRGEQRLVGVAHRRVGDEELLLLAHPAGELLGAELLVDVPRAFRQVRDLVRPHRAGGGGVPGDVAGAGGAEVGALFALHVRVAVDDDVGEVGQQLGGAVLPRAEVEEFRRLVEEPRGHGAVEELRVDGEVQQERDVRLHAADAELLEAAFEPPGGVHEPQAAGRHLYQQRVVEGGDDGAVEGAAGIEADAGAAGRAVGGEPAVVGA